MYIGQSKISKMTVLVLRWYSKTLPSGNSCLQATSNPAEIFQHAFSKIQQTQGKNISKQGRQQVDLRTARFQLKFIRTALHLLSFSPNIQSQSATGHSNQKKTQIVGLKPFSTQKKVAKNSPETQKPLMFPKPMSRWQASALPPAQTGVTSLEFP